jgi:hypothetical protein
LKRRRSIREWRYGRITITHAEGKLRWAFRGMSEPLAHRHYDTFELPEAPESAAIARIRPSVSTVSAYSIHGITTVVVAQNNDGQLTLTVRSQPTYTLRPYQS